MPKKALLQPVHNAMSREVLIEIRPFAGLPELRWAVAIR